MAFVPVVSHQERGQTRTLFLVGKEGRVQEACPKVTPENTPSREWSSGSFGTCTQADGLGLAPQVGVVTRSKGCLLRWREVRVELAGVRGWLCEVLIEAVL